MSPSESQIRMHDAYKACGFDVTATANYLNQTTSAVKKPSSMATLAAQEAYSIKGAYYASCRATEANLWHHKHGIHGGRDITLGEILEKYPIEK